jgi:hypothetical protein
MNRRAGTWVTLAAAALLPLGASASARVDAQAPPAGPAAEPLLVLDGALLASGFAFLPGDAEALGVVRTEQLTAAEAVRRWGERGRGGAIVMMTQATFLRLTEHLAHIETVLEHFAAREEAPPCCTIIRPPPQPGSRALVVVEGRVVRRDAAMLDALGPVDIEVMRGAVARELYGTLGWFGVILLTPR